jgi:hypothetical protein
VNGNIIFRVNNTIYYIAPTAVYTDITAVHLLFEEGANIGHFSWKPDGSAFAYRRGNAAIYEMTTGGAKHAVLDTALEGGNGGTDPTWSPDGTKLVYSWDDQLYTVAADRIPHGAAPVAVTNFFQAKTSPGWAIVPAGDVTPPTISIASGPSGTVAPTTAKFKFTGSEPLVTFFCELDGALPKPCPAASTYSKLSQGMHTLKVYGTDLAGNPSPTLTRTWTISSIQIARIVYRASTLNGETISLKNNATSAVALGSWKITSSSASYSLPTFSLGAGTTVTVHSGAGTKTATQLYMGRTAQFWPNTSSTATLKRANATIADTCSYNSASASAKNC